MEKSRSHKSAATPDLGLREGDGRTSSRRSQKRLAPDIRDDSKWESGSFSDRYEFFDDVHHSIRLSRIERDILDSPEFQRLFRLGQLGFVDLVFRTANHTRGTHSVGACHIAKMLVDKLNGNRAGRVQDAGEQHAIPEISRSERALIGIGALLHDIPHGPFSHDIEKKTHHIFPAGPGTESVKVNSHYGLYDKHDDFASNPALYVALLDTDNSVLARVLRDYSPEFWALLQADAKDHPHLADFVNVAKNVWPDCEHQLLPALLFHLSYFEKPEDAEIATPRLKKSFSTEAALSAWGLGPEAESKALHFAWYQPFRHDIIGDTLSADLIDYLLRDQARLGMKNELDLKLLNHYVLVPSPDSSTTRSAPTTYRCAIDLTDHKRGTFRAERLNDLFRLLDLRHQIHEKAVYHRVVQSAIAMLARAGLVLGVNKPAVAELYGHTSGTPALAGDHHFLQLLIQRTNELVPEHETRVIRAAEEHQSIPFKLAERRVYRPLMVIPGDRVPTLLNALGNPKEELQYTLRALAAIVDSTYFSRFFLLISLLIEKFLQHVLDSEVAVNEEVLQIAADIGRLRRVYKNVPKRVIFWTTPYKQLYKDPAILVCADEMIKTIDELRKTNGIGEALQRRVDAGILDAETKNEGLWKLYVFLSDGLFYTGSFAKLRPNHPCQKALQHEAHLRTAQDIVVRALRHAWKYWQTANHKIELGEHIEDSALSELLKLFVNDARWTAISDENLTQKVSAVKVTAYLHGEEDSTNCRDVRYKFNADQDISQVIASVVKPEYRDLVKQAYDALGLEPGYLEGEELKEVVCRLAAASEEQIMELVEPAARNAPVNAETLKALWHKELD